MYDQREVQFILEASGTSTFGKLPSASQSFSRVLHELRLPHPPTLRSSHFNVTLCTWRQPSKVTGLRVNRPCDSNGLHIMTQRRPSHLRPSMRHRPWVRKRYRARPARL